MSGSAAEERIRSKSEAMLRTAWPEARIVHELVLEQGGCRIDLAAITPDRLIAVEIKSERDTLSRLAAQVRAASKVAGTIWLCVAEKHVSAIERMADARLPFAEAKTPVVRQGKEVGWRFAENPAYLPEIRHCTLFVEDHDGALRLKDGHRFWRDRERVLSPSDQLAMLWAEELRSVCAGLDLGKRSTRRRCISLACEMLTGRQIRRAVCGELLTRPFPRADEIRRAAA
jgi:hypothetical protein